jgi:UDPglucose 6-dehydrogenase
MTLISIIGSGVVGTTTGIGFHKLGNDILFYDISKRRMAELVEKGYKVGTSINEVISKTNITFVCIDTPTPNGKQDTKSLERAISEISEALECSRRYHLVVFRSTILPGTMTRIVDYLDKNCSRTRGKDYDVCYNPEFFRHRSSLKDFQNPDRVIIGEDKPNSSIPLRKLYKPISGKILVTSFEAAEMIKYASNSFLSLKISFFNEIWMLCKEMKIDDKILSHAVSLDHRIGNYGIEGGRPFSGSCLHKDLEAFTSFVRKLKISPDLLRTALQINNEMQKTFTKQISSEDKKYLRKRQHGKRKIKSNI